jgi:MobA/MobL family
VGNHIQTTVIQKSRGHTALARLAYQSCDFFDDGFRKADYQPFSDTHLGHVILLPDGAPPEFAQAENFLMAAAFREHRKDAQEGRALDFTIPRAVPDHLLLAVAAFTVLPFVALGMATRVDIECPRASDDELNPHAHCYLAQRRLEPDGFGPKQRSWNVLFRRDSGRHFRAIIAGRLTLACAILGIKAHVDPRRNDEIGAEKPEPRLAPVLWRIYQKGGNVRAIEELKTQRRLKFEFAAPNDEGTGPQDCISVGSAVPFPDNQIRAVAALKVVMDFAQKAGLHVERFPGEAGSYLTPVRLGGSSIIFDGQAFRMKGEGGAVDAELIVDLARALEWPAIVVEGDAQLADTVIFAGAAVGLTAVNRAASTTMLRRISETRFDNFVDQIADHDPLGVIADLLSTYVPPTYVPPAYVSAFEDDDGLDRLVDYDHWQTKGPPSPESVSQDDRAQRRLDELQRILDEGRLRDTCVPLRRNIPPIGSP